MGSCSTIVMTAPFERGIPGGNEMEPALNNNASGEGGDGRAFRPDLYMGQRSACALAWAQSGRDTTHRLGPARCRGPHSGAAPVLHVASGP